MANWEKGGLCFGTVERDTGVLKGNRLTWVSVSDGPGFTQKLSVLEPYVLNNTLNYSLSLVYQ